MERKLTIGQLSEIAGVPRKTLASQLFIPDGGSPVWEGTRGTGFRAFPVQEVPPSGQGDDDIAPSDAIHQSRFGRLNGSDSSACQQAENKG